MKKISLALILICLIASCGKKGDPEYEDQKKRLKFKVALLKKFNEIYKKKTYYRKSECAKYC